MWQRFSFYDARVIAHHLGTLITLSGIVMLVPALTGLCFLEWAATARYLIGVGASLIAGSLLRLQLLDPGKLNRQQALAVTGLGWLALSLLGAIPFALSGNFPSYLDALFDAVSGYSATGVSIIGGLDHLSNADNMWRFIMQFLGGVGLVVAAMAIGSFSSSSSNSMYQAEARNEHIMPNIMETARFIVRFSCLIIIAATLVLAATLLALGMSPDRAVLHALWLNIAGFMTAGFAPMSESVLYYHSIAVEWILMVVMLVGGINFTLHAVIMKGRTRDFFQDIETRTALLWWVLLLVAFMAALSRSPVFSQVTDLLRNGLFNFVSASTTTGFLTITTNQLNGVIPSGAMLILVLTMAIGASAGSTSGGIKLMRIGIIAKSAYETLRNAISPDSALVTESYHHIGKRRLDSEIVKESMTVFILFAITYVVGALVGVAHGYDALDAIFESVTMASNSGISAGISSPAMPATLKLTYIVEMWAGRLEFVTFFALFVKIAVSASPRRLLREARGMRHASDRSRR